MHTHMGLTSDLGVTGSYLKGQQFEAGIVAKITKAPEMIEANEGFGFKEGDHKGQALRLFLEVAGEERTFDTTSVRLISAMDPFNVGDTVLIKRSGSAMKTEWSVTKADAPVAAPEAGAAPADGQPF